ncbi:MAG: polysaccharide biosynthesis protein [Bacteroidales bacterium]|nr:polysaccharide biosynthesis protein [Bacteroidales bacterium]
MRNFIRKLHIAPAWLVLLLDCGCVVVASLLTLLLRENYHFLTAVSFKLWEYLFLIALILVVRMGYFFLFKSNKVVIRYTNTQDIARLFWCCLAGSGTFLLLNGIAFLVTNRFVIPTSIIVVEFFITTFLLSFYRLAFKIIFLETVNPTKLKKNIVIFGAGEAGLTTKRALDRDTRSKYNVLAFFDDSLEKIGKNLESIPVYSSEKLPDYLSKNDISFLIIAIQNLSATKKNQITEIALQYQVKVLVVPPVSKWINGELSFKQIKTIKIEDLLEREEINIDKNLIYNDLKGKTIFITGAAGSIGSEIVRQVMNFPYKQLVLIDNAETPVFFLTSECRSLKAQNVAIHIASITDEEQMEELFSHYKPDLVYHAAAYKHVPLMEENVNAAIKTNVRGTKLLADLAVKHGVGKFVMISTDKAVNPTNVMGASKRIAEIYVQSLHFYQKNTKFITTRFGNVLGSNGSVIPIFRKQIENGGPILVTHPEITRYFMTISEACQLVLNAGAFGQGGEIFIFDMGHSVKIYDLAKKMVQLSGLTLDKDIKIEFSGLRPGEKLYEELLANQENTIKTQYEKIMVAKVRTYDYEEVSKDISRLIARKDDSPFDIVKAMKEIVPEYISQNSVFESSNKKDE